MTSMDIPGGTTFVIVDLDREKERVQIEFSLDGKVMRAWVARLSRLVRAFRCNATSLLKFLRNDPCAPQPRNTVERRGYSCRVLSRPLASAMVSIQKGASSMLTRGAL